MLLLFISNNTFSLTPKISITLQGNITTNTNFLYNPNSSDIIISDKNIYPNFGFGVDIRSSLPWEQFAISISLERITGIEHFTKYFLNENNEVIPVSFKEGFEMYPIELTGYFIAPFSSENITFYFGGGVGLYTGKRIYSINEIEATTISSSTNFGIHVLTGAEFKIIDFFSLRTEAKFRDPQIDVTTKFNQNEIDGVPLSTTPATTRINVNGLHYSVGVVFNF